MPLNKPYSNAVTLLFLTNFCAEHCVHLQASSSRCWNLCISSQQLQSTRRAVPCRAMRFVGSRRWILLSRDPEQTPLHWATPDGFVTRSYKIGFESVFSSARRHPRRWVVSDFTCKSHLHTGTELHNPNTRNTVSYCNCFCATAQMHVIVTAFGSGTVLMYLIWRFISCAACVTHYNHLDLCYDEMFTCHTISCYLII